MSLPRAPPAPAVSLATESSLTLVVPHLALPPGATLTVEARIAPAPWSQARTFPVASGARSTTLSPLIVQSPYDVRWVIRGSDGARLAESAPTSADTAPVGCGGEKTSAACAVA
jgi:hypothetical protein